MTLEVGRSQNKGPPRSTRQNPANFIALMFYIVNRFLVVGLWCLRGKEFVRAQGEYPSTLQRYFRGEYFDLRGTRVHGP